jgi:hypothetical protein
MNYELGAFQFVANSIYASSLRAERSNPEKQTAVRTRFYLVRSIHAGCACIFALPAGKACQNRPDEAQPRPNQGVPNTQYQILSTPCSDVLKKELHLRCCLKNFNYRDIFIMQ